MKTVFILAVTAFLVFIGTNAFSGDLECYDHTSTTSHFECGTHGNCVWWAAYMRPDIAKEVSGSGWNGGQWYEKLKDKGFDVGSVPKIGAIVEFSGHVAYVKSLGENGSFNVSEMDATGALGNGILYATYYKGSGNTYHRNSNPGTDKRGSWILNGFIYRNPSGTNSYCADISSVWGICWTPSDTDVSCQGGKNWRLYDYEQGSVIIVSTNEYCPKPDGTGGGQSISDPVDLTNTFNPQNLPNLRLQEMKVYRGDTLLHSTKNQSQAGEKLTIEAYIVSEKADCNNGNEHQVKNLETDIEVQIGSGHWENIGTKETQPSTLTKDHPHKESVEYEIPPEARGKLLRFRSYIDAGMDINETNENDNVSDPNNEQYPVVGNYNLIVAYARLTNNQTTVYLNSIGRVAYGLKNIGPDTPLSSQGVRTVVEVKKPGATSYTLIAEDGSDSNELSPNRLQEESTSADGFSFNQVGIWTFRIRTDCYNKLIETNEADNELTFTVTVKEDNRRANVIITDLGLKEGSNFKKDTKVHPWGIFKNTGDAYPAGPITIDYLIDGHRRDGDTIQASELGPGVSKEEKVNNNDIRLGSKGNRTLTVRASINGTVVASRDYGFKVR